MNKEVETVTLQVTLLKSDRANAKQIFNKYFTCYLFADEKSDNIKDRLSNDNLNEIIGILQSQFSSGNIIKIALRNSYYGYNAKLENSFKNMNNDTILALRNAFYTINMQAGHIENIKNYGGL